MIFTVNVTGKEVAKLCEYVKSLNVLVDNSYGISDNASNQRINDALGAFDDLFNGRFAFVPGIFS